MVYEGYEYFEEEDKEYIDNKSKQRGYAIMKIIKYDYRPDVPSPILSKP